MLMGILLLSPFVDGMLLLSPNVVQYIDAVTYCLWGHCCCHLLLMGILLLPPIFDGDFAAVTFC